MELKIFFHWFLNFVKFIIHKKLCTLWHHYPSAWPKLCIKCFIFVSIVQQGQCWKNFKLSIREFDWVIFFLKSVNVLDEQLWLLISFGNISKFVRNLNFPGANILKSDSNRLKEWSRLNSVALRILFRETSCHVSFVKFWNHWSSGN